LGLAVAASATAAVPLAVLLGLGLDADEQIRSSRAAKSGAGLPPSPRAAFRVPRPTPLAASRAATWASVGRTVVARASPDTRGRPVARLARYTPEGTRNIVLVKARRRDGTGRLWVCVDLPVLPRGSTGWVPRVALAGYGTVRTRLLVDRRRLRATLIRDGRPVFRASIGIGQARWPTPAGRFYIRSRLTRHGRPFYGPVAFGTSARSSALTEWPGGGFIGIHGTNRPALLPGRVSHGCIRLRNADVLRLARLMPAGTPVEVV
jgi:lipoprotein-anchoring transpeptidase ErfK/SrfK